VKITRLLLGAGSRSLTIPHIGFRSPPPVGGRPVSHDVFESPVVWGLFSWQNTVCFLGLLLWLSAIVLRQRRTPLELLMPELDRKLVEFVRPA
jgi:hypothetical protein